MYIDSQQIISVGIKQRGSGEKAPLRWLDNFNVFALCVTEICRISKIFKLTDLKRTERDFFLLLFHYTAMAETGFTLRGNI